LTNPGQPAPLSRRPAWEIPFLTALLAATIWVACFYTPGVWLLTGIGEADKPFLDLRNLVSAGEAAQLGHNPYVDNPLDPYHRPHGFSSWWLVGGRLGLTREDIAWLGTLLLGLTLASTVLLLRPAGWRQGAGLLLVLVSPPLLFLVNRANHDLVVFVLMSLALGCLRHERTAVRALAIILLAVSAVLKYFPLAAVVILLDARTRRELAGWVLLYGLVLVLAWPSLEQALHTAASHTPAPAWLFAFGAPTFFRNLGLADAAAWGWLVAGLVLLAMAVSWWRSAARKTLPTTGEARTLEREFACGAVMIVGCFLHGSSYLYKIVFALWLLPWLWRATLDQGEDRWRKATQSLLLAVLWFEGGATLAVNLSVFTDILSPPVARRCLEVTIQIGQLFTWALVACLWRALLLYLGRETRRLLAGPR
jgi:hypothetical protein